MLQISFNDFRVAVIAEITIQKAKFARWVTNESSIENTKLQIQHKKCKVTV